MNVRPVFVGRSAVVGLLVTAVVGTGAVAASAQAATPRAGLRLDVDARHHVIATNSTQPGLVHVLNTGTHSVIVVRRLHKGVPGLISDLDSGDTTAGAVRLYKDFPLVDWVEPHANEYVRLTKGTYYLVDPALDNVRSDEIHVLTVTGTTDNTPAPRATLVEAAPNGHVTPRVSMTSQSFAHVVNRTATPQIISIASIKPGLTNAQLRAYIDNPKRQSYRTVVGKFFLPLGQIAAHTDIYRSVAAKPARYLLFAASLTTQAGLGKGQVGLLTVR